MSKNISELFNLENKSAIITGGNKGIGFEIVNTLYNAGCKIVIIDILPDEGQTSEFDKKRVKYLKYDLLKTNNINSSFNEAIKFLGDIDILINSAGINKRFFAEDYPLDIWKEVININLTTTFYFSQLAGKVMLKKKIG